MKKLLLSLISLFFFVGLMAQYNVYFQVDMAEAEGFDPATQGVFMAGDFLGWEEPGSNLDYQLTLLEGSETIYELMYEFPGDTVVNYKYFIVDNGGQSWDGGEWAGDPNRLAVLNAETTLENVWGDKPMSTTFNVDVSNVEPFGTDTTEVFIAGDFAGWAQPGTVKYWMMEPSGDDPMIYTFTTVLYPGDYQFKFFFVYNEEASWDYGEWTGDPNRTFTIVNDTTMDYVWGEIASIDNNFTSNSSLNVYPNPCQNTINVALDETAKIEKVEVMSITGAIVRNINNVNNTTLEINTSDLNSGLYFITIHSQDGIKTAKFIKE